MIEKFIVTLPISGDTRRKTPAVNGVGAIPILDKACRQRKAIDWRCHRHCVDDCDISKRIAKLTVTIIMNHIC